MPGITFIVDRAYIDLIVIVRGKNAFLSHAISIQHADLILLFQGLRQCTITVVRFKYFIC